MILKIFGYLNRKQLLMACGSITFILLQVSLDLRLPEYLSEITRLTQTPGSAMSAIWAAGGKMLLCAFGGLCCAITIGFFASRIGSSFSRGLRKRLFDKVESFSLEEINRFSTDSLIIRTTNDVMQIQMLITMGLQAMVRAPITAFMAITKIAGKGIEWTVATGIAVTILISMHLLLMRFVVPKFQMMQSLTDNINRITRENLIGLRVIRAYNAEDYQEQKFDRANLELMSTHLFTSRSMAIMNPTMQLIMSSMSLTIYWIGAHLIDVAQIPERMTLFSNMVVFSSYATQVIMSFQMLVMIFNLLPRATVSVGRVLEVLETEPTIIDGEQTEGLPGLQGEVTFNHVSFKYPDAVEYMLEDISFTVKQGDTLAFIGSTGSGKSTLINLIPRFYDVTDGEILVDGVDVRDYTQEALRNKIGYVPQKAVLFRGTVSSNVAYWDRGGEPYTMDDVVNAVTIAQGADFVERMNNQYNADIAQGGTNVSGGQKQRISIARAICRNPEIYIFDDSFSALDYKTDRILRTALKKEMAGVTSIIVAQRIGTIMDADQIVVLDEGKLVGIGRHKELLQSCEVYRQIAESQLSEEELAS